MKIRIARLNDLESIVKIYNQAVKAGNATADLNELSLADRKAWFSEHHKDTFPVYIIKVDDKIIGYGSLSPYRKGRGALRATAEISYYLDYQHHGLGYGRKLIEYIINDCDRLGIKNLFALLMEINKTSVILLEKTGFKKWGFMPDVVSINGKTCGHLIYGRKV